MAPRWVSVAIMATVAVLVPTAAGATTTTSTAPTPAPVTAGTAPLVLVSQTPWVATGGTFDLRLVAGPGAPPMAQLGLSVSVYACLSSVSAFDQSVSSTAAPAGTPIDSTRTPLAVSSLAATTGGGFDLSMPVSVGRSTATGADGFAINLTSSNGQCVNYPSGVYPVRVQLIDTANGQTVGGLTTHLVYTGTPATTQKLRVAVVLPIATTLGPAPDPAAGQLTIQPAAALAQPSTAATSAVTATVSAIATGGHQSVPLTLEASPQTVVDLANSGHGATVDQLATLADVPSIHQFASAPYVPVNASALVSAGLEGELDLQVARGVQVLAARLPRTSSATSVGAAGGGLGAWFTNDGLDAATLSRLQTDGYRQLVVPAASVPAAPTNDSTAEPFPLAPSSGPAMVAVAANADLTARFTGAPGNPVLAASQLAAELAQIYFEKPNDISPRIVVVMAPSDWTDDPAFVTTVLGALDQNPVVQPVTTSDLFGILPTATCRGGCRTTATAGSAGLPVAAIRIQRPRVAALATAAAAPAARGITTQLGDLVLAGQAERLRPLQQSAVLHNTGAAVDAQLDQLQVAGDQSITLTSQKGRVPVTIVSTAPYPVKGTLTLTSDKLTFPNGRTRSVTVQPSPHTNSFYVNVETRASGLFKVDIALYSPAGGLTLAGGTVSVRSTATSVVGVVLSLGAVAVLVVWWLRTSRKRRALRRAADAGEPDGHGGPPGPVEPPVRTGAT